MANGDGEKNGNNYMEGVGNANGPIQTLSQR